MTMRDFASGMRADARHVDNFIEQAARLAECVLESAYTDRITMIRAAKLLCAYHGADPENVPTSSVHERYAAQVFEYIDDSTAK